MRVYEKPDKNYFFRNIVFFCLLLIFTIFFTITKNNVYKILASLSFVVTGVMNYFCGNHENKNFAHLLLIGLVCGMIGDIAILIDFKFGAICFAIGHILYIISFCKLRAFSIKDMLPISFFLVVSIAIVLIVLPQDTSMGMKIVCLVYAGIISFMTGKAVGLQLLMKNKLTLILCIGSVAFFVSDIAVLLVEFSETNDILYTNINHFTYFPAQFVIAQGLAPLNVLSKQ